MISKVPKNVCYSLNLIVFNSLTKNAQHAEGKRNWTSLY